MVCFSLFALVIAVAAARTIDAAETQTADPQQCQAIAQFHYRLGDVDASKQEKYNRKIGKVASMQRIPDQEWPFETLNEGKLIYWGNFGYEIKLSAYNATSSIVSSVGHRGQRYNFVPPQAQNRIKQRVYLTDGGNYVAFASVFFDKYQHLLIDHLGYLAYMKNKLPADYKFLIMQADHTSNVMKRLLQVIDPQFVAERVQFLNCEGSLKQCNVMVDIRNGGSLTVFRPNFPCRHVQLYGMVREWFLSSYKPKRILEPTVVFYTRGHGSLVHGRVMDQSQEERLVRDVEHALKRYNRPERIVMFDGSLDIEDQVELFYSASVIMGPHGGGLANMLFAHAGKSCEDRVKVLEFVTSKATPMVQDGMRRMSFYSYYETAPWVEFHNVLFVPPSNGDVTFVNELDFADAVNAVFANRYWTSSGTRTSLRHE